MTEQEHLWECIGLKGECPDCGKYSLQRKGSYVHCRLCRATFFADNLSVQRVKIEKPNKAANWDGVFKGLRIP